MMTSKEIAERAVTETKDAVAYCPNCFKTIEVGEPCVTLPQDFTNGEAFCDLKCANAFDHWVMEEDV